MNNLMGYGIENKKSMASCCRKNGYSPVLCTNNPQPLFLIFLILAPAGGSKPAGPKLKIKKK